MHEETWLRNPRLDNVEHIRADPRRFVSFVKGISFLFKVKSTNGHRYIRTRSDSLLAPRNRCSGHWTVSDGAEWTDEKKRFNGILSSSVNKLNIRSEKIKRIIKRETSCCGNTNRNEMKPNKRQINARLRRKCYLAIFTEEKEKTTDTSGRALIRSSCVLDRIQFGWIIKTSRIIVVSIQRARS